ncbi:hypothetical protein GH5_06525 [Leishmania sp. Ghana 2012 LV757]|uniref:hypothetical protein n=1 Tax=Leishmania sp. Ghana 2012 LV757 TaxID=2803181 RepID=UPI001B705552|nr:hypothetical protein GH5_06525 [Leishmania sp. Ghana 2012 LV757]
MYTSYSDASDESTFALQWRVSGFDSSASAPAMPRDGVKDSPTRATAALTVPTALFWGDSRDGGGAAASIAKSPLTLSMTAELAPLASSASSRSSGTAANNTRSASNGAYNVTRMTSGPTAPAKSTARRSEGKRKLLRQSEAAPADLSMGPESLSGRMGGGTGFGTFRYTTVSSAVEPPQSAMRITLHESDDGDDDAFDIIKESIKRQLVGIEEDDRASDATRGNSEAALQQRLQPQSQPQQHRYSTVPPPGSAAGAWRTGSDGRLTHNRGASALPAPRSTAAVRQREMATTRCSSSSASILEQRAACVGQSSVPKTNAPLASASSNGADSFRAQPLPSQPRPPQVSTQKASQLTSQQQRLQHHQPQQHKVQTVACPRSAAASRAAFFEQQQQLLSNGDVSTAGNANTRVDAKIRTGGLRFPLPTPGAPPMVARRPSSHLDPSCNIGNRVAAAAAAARLSAAPSAARQSDRFSSLRPSSPTEEPAAAGRHYDPRPHHQYPHQLHPASSVAQLRHNLQPHQPKIPSLHLEGLQEKYAAKRKQEYLPEDTWHQQQRQPSAPRPPQPPQQKCLQVSSLTSCQAVPRFPNLPLHLQPQSFPQTQRPSHPQQPLSQSQSQHSQQQQLGGSAPPPSVAMMPGKTYAATPQGRLILLTPEGVRASRAQSLQQLLPPPPPPPPSPPPPPAPNATAFAHTGNYVTVSSYAALFCRNNPLHSMRYPGSESKIARQLKCDSGHPKSGKITAATYSSSVEHPGAQALNKTTSFVASEKYAPRGLTAGQSRGAAAANQAEARVTVAPTVATKSSSNAEVPRLPTCSPAAATGASAIKGSSAVTGGNYGRSAAAFASGDTQPPTGSVASLLARSSHGSAHGATAGAFVQHLGIHSCSGSSVDVASRRLQLPAFPPREDISRTSPAGGAHHPKLSPAAVSASLSNGAATSLLSRVQPVRVDPDRNGEADTAKALSVPSICLRAGGSNAQLAGPRNRSDSHCTSSGAVAITSEESVTAAGLISLSDNARGNSSAFAQLTTGLPVHNSGLGVDDAGAGDSGHANCFTHLASPPMPSPLASSVSYCPLVAVDSTNGRGDSMHISTQAPFRQDPAGSRQPVARGDISAQGAKLSWSDTVSLPLTQDPVGLPPQQRQTQQQQQHFRMPRPSSSFSESHSPASDRLRATVDDSMAVTIPITNADGTITAAVVAVPPPFAHTEAGVQPYWLAALQRQYSQPQRLAPPLWQHNLHKGAPAEEQPSAIGAGEGEEWRRRHQTLLTLQLENERCQAQQQQPSPPPVRVSMTNDRRLHHIVSASSVEAFAISGQTYRSLHSVHGETLAREAATAAADGHADAASFHSHSHSDVGMHVYPEAEL